MVYYINTYLFIGQRGSGRKPFNSCRRLPQRKNLLHRSEILGKLVSKDLLYIFKLPFTGITKPAIKRLARRAGITRISGLVYPEIRNCLQVFLQIIMEKAVLYCEHSNRKTIMATDVVEAVRLNGRKLYGYGTD